MIIFDLLFIVVFLTSVVTLIMIAVNILRRRSRQALKLLKIYGIGLAIYLGVVVLVSLASPQRVYHLGEKRCFDDWCIAVEDVTLAHELGQGENTARTDGVFYVIILRLSNRARGRDQRASSAAVHLVDGQGRVYDISLQGQEAYEGQHGLAAPLTSMLPVGQSITTVQVFELPKDAQDVGLTVEHPVGPSPGLFIIGDEASLFHKPTIVRLP